MDLIKKLGGYENARAMRDSNIDSFDGDASGVRIHYMGDCFYQEDLDLSLLKYRREHNIFEVGDFIFHPMFGALFEIKRIAEKYVVASTKSEYETNLLIELISHATDAEIKAGHRL